MRPRERKSEEKTNETLPSRINSMLVVSLFSTAKTSSESARRGQMSETPRTDAEFASDGAEAWRATGRKPFVSKAFADDLERKLAEANRRLVEACIIGLAVAGGLCENPDEWLRGHEKRLRELEKMGRGTNER
jgi:hypothetical protein